MGAGSRSGVDHTGRGDLYHSLLFNEEEEDEDEYQAEDDAGASDRDEDISGFDTGGDAASGDAELISVQQERSRRDYLTASRTRAQSANVVCNFTRALFLSLARLLSLFSSLSVCARVRTTEARAWVCTQGT